MLFRPHERILFIGDSITDADRGRDPAGLGLGYVRFIATYAAAMHPSLGLEFENRGVSGDTVRHLEARWERDVLAPHPHWVSISIGINDVWRQLDGGPGPVFIDEFQATLARLVERTRAENIRPLFMEPSIIEESPLSEGNRRLAPYVQAVRDLALRHGAPLVPVHEELIMFASAHPRPRLTVDGVHLSITGTGRMAMSWLAATGLIPGTR